MVRPVTALAVALSFALSPRELELHYAPSEGSQVQRVFETEWIVDAASDRTACRLTGGRLESGPAELDSTPLVDGTVQVPGDGEPLIFMRDRPTIGGYPKLGSVEPIALDLLAQAQPGTHIRFKPADVERALAAIVQREHFFGIAKTQPSS